MSLDLGVSHPGYCRVVPTSRPRKPRHPDVATTEILGGVPKRELVIVDSDPSWPAAYQHHAARIRAALGPTAISVEHIGSTAVPGLTAKPIIDILVTVDDITAEEDYLPPLLDAGYVLRIREPGHRMVRTPSVDVQVHLLQDDDPAAAEYLLFRDHLRRTPADRELYERTKLALAEQDWADINAYAEAKTPVIAEIKERVRRGASRPGDGRLT